ncbi:hypothetical protein CEXT_375871 [Caerostris extrusa]|uniref:Uncharacterized protein n=1 Tax=Caerostris extrusa TaxID=172846 RepID=A0AAV4VSQ7_CAEEX|nr:hypothetical protein CEXT_375871 [Caerostris extrusa]
MPQSGWVPYHLVHYRTVAERSKENTWDYGNFPQRTLLRKKKEKNPTSFLPVITARDASERTGPLSSRSLPHCCQKETKKIPGIMEIFGREFVSGGHISLAGDSASWARDASERMGPLSSHSLPHCCQKKHRKYPGLWKFSAENSSQVVILV